MLNEPKPPILTATQKQVLATLQDGVQSWDEIKAATKLSDERLGTVLGELFDQRKIWTGHRGDVRLYGLERRVGLRPRLAHLQRRSTD